MPAPVPEGRDRRFIAGSRAHFRYNLALHAALLLTAPAWIPWVLVSRKRRRNVADRLGIRRPRIPAPSGKQRLWVHAVSVGETLSAVPLVREIRRRLPNLEILLSTVTITGQEVARRSMGETTDGIFYFPFDLPGICSRFFHRVRPDLLVILETEIWPNLLAECAKRGVPALLLNGRVSTRSMRGYSRFRTWSSSVLACLDTIAVQTEEDAERIQALGVDPTRVRVTGNMKFDVTVPESSASEWFDRYRTYRSSGGLWFVAGSTHEGEEEAVLQAFARARKVNGSVRLLLAPRHPERFPAVEDLCRTSGWEVVRRSRMSEGEDRRETPVVLLDTMGELTAAYSAADIAFVGGSLVPRGGHNILEPALFGVPTIVGPHMENFREISDLFTRGDAVTNVADAEGLAATLAGWAADPAPFRATGDRAKRLLDEFRGATGRNAEIVVSALVRRAEGAT